MRIADETHCRARAYELWEAAGQPEGLHLEHWAQAEVELADSNEQTPALRPGDEKAGGSGFRDVTNGLAPG